MYRESADPWRFASSAYELARYAATIRALQGRRFRRAFEPGCSVGVLTEQLAGICSNVDAMDISPTAVERTRKRCGNLPNVSATCAALPSFLPHVPYDLIVLSEIGYYFEAADLKRLSDQLVGALEPGGVFLAVHWLGYSPDHVLNGDRVHEVLSTVEGLSLDLSERHDSPGSGEAGFRLDRWERVCLERPRT